MWTHTHANSQSWQTYLDKKTSIAPTTSLNSLIGRVFLERESLNLSAKAERLFYLSANAERLF
jgi:hypothetical protein